MLNLFYLIVVLNHPMVSNPSETLLCPSAQTGSYFGVVVTKGHFNADLFEDLVVLESDFVNSQGDRVGAAHIYYGSGNGYSQVPDQTIEGQHKAYQGKRGLVRAAIADFNNDGYDDLALGTPNSGSTSWQYKKGYFMVFLSRQDGTGLDTSAPFFKQVGPREPYGLASQMDVGDVNGDGVEDLIVSAPYSLINNTAYYGRIFIYFGGGSSDPHLFDSTPDITLGGTVDDYMLGKSIQVGDLNNDGIQDLITTGYPQRELLVFFGGDPYPTSPDANRRFDYLSLMAVGDLNGDFIDDLVFSKTTDRKKIFVLPGSSSFDINASTTLTHQSKQVPYYVYDINQDGYGDLFSRQIVGDKTTVVVFKGTADGFLNIQEPLVEFLDSDSSAQDYVKGVIPVLEAGCPPLLIGASHSAEHAEVVQVYQHVSGDMVLAPNAQVQGIAPLEFLPALECWDPDSINVTWFVSPTVSHQSTSSSLTFDAPSNHLLTEVWIEVNDLVYGTSFESRALVLTAANSQYFDYNGDGCNNYEDVQAFAPNWRQDLSSDPNADGRVDIRDFLFIRTGGCN